MANQLKTKFSEQMLYAEREAMLLAILLNKEATLADLYDFIGGLAADVPKGVTVGDLLRGDIKKDVKITRRRKPKTKSEPKSKARGKAKRSKTKANKEVNVKRGKVRFEVRTQNGRDRLDENLGVYLQANSKRKFSSKELCKIFGITNLQLRSAMSRLIEAGYATWEGKTNQMRYFAA